MPTLKKRYFLVRTFKNKYLVSLIGQEGSFGKNWQSLLYFTAKKQRATRHETQGKAEISIVHYQGYTKDQQLLIIEEIWE